MNNNQQLHLVIGGAGAIGSAVINELRSRNIPVKALERKKAIKGIETTHADVLDLEAFTKAAAGATHIYVCVGLPYFARIWQRDWPSVMKNTIEVCKTYHAKLIFFDNVYMYGPPPLSMPFTEDNEQKPVTKKGKARKETADLLLAAMRKGEVQGVIGRSADFYGPYAVNSPFYIVFLENILKNKNPQWLGKPNVRHTYAFTKDNARALLELALDESCYGQVWHLPVGKPVAIEEIMMLINRYFHSEYKISYMPRALLNIMGLFIPILKEAKEMIYQFDDPYVVSFEKFKRKFPNFTVTPYDRGIQEMIMSFREN